MISLAARVLPCLLVEPGAAVDFSGSSGVRQMDSLDLLDDDLENDSALSELKANVLASRSDLAQLGHCVQSLLRRDHNAPLAAVLLLQQLDQHVRRVVREASLADRADDVVLAEVFEVLSGVLGSFDPEGIVLSRLALVRDVSVEQTQPLLHRDQILDEQR